MNKTSFSIIICTKNRSVDLDKCLNSINRQTYPPDEVIIVDASSDGESKKIARYHKDKNHFNVIYIPSLPGLTRQRNIGIKKCSADIIVFFDDDVIIDDKYLEQMAFYFDLDPSLGGATGHITNNPEKKPLETWLKFFFMLAGSGKKGVMLRSGFAAFLDPKYVNVSKTTEVLSGCNMLYRKAILKKFKFDEAFEGYSLMEDVEFSHRVSKRHSLLYVKKAKLIHNRSNTERIDLQRFFEMSTYNHYYIFKKNVKQSFTDWIFFFWSDLGHVLKSLQWTLIARNMTAMKGFFSGHIKMLKRPFE